MASKDQKPTSEELLAENVQLRADKVAVQATVQKLVGIIEELKAENLILMKRIEQLEKKNPTQTDKGSGLFIGFFQISGPRGNNET